MVYYTASLINLKRKRPWHNVSLFKTNYMTSKLHVSLIGNIGQHLSMEIMLSTTIKSVCSIESIHSNEWNAKSLFFCTPDDDGARRNGMVANMLFTRLCDWKWFNTEHTDFMVQRKTILWILSLQEQHKKRIFVVLPSSFSVCVRLFLSASLSFFMKSHFAIFVLVFIVGNKTKMLTIERFQ